MKKLAELIPIMIGCFFTLFLLSDGFAAGPESPVATPPQQTGPNDNFNANPKSPKTTGSSPQTLPSNSQKPGEAKAIRLAKITNLEIWTDSNGTWFWKASIKNIGTASLGDCYLLAQLGSIIFSAPQSTWKAASGTLLNRGTLAPNQSVDVKYFWSRCCLTDQIKVELGDKVTNTIWDTKTISNLIYSTAPMRALDVRVKRIEWNESGKDWKATIKNRTNYTVKIMVQGYLWPAGTTTPLPAGGQQLTLGPQAEVTTMLFTAPTAKNGDMLKVHTRFIMGSGTCNENPENCGSKESNNITIPNSANF